MSQQKIIRVVAPLTVLLVGALAIAQSPPGEQGPGKKGGFPEGGKRGGGIGPTPTVQLATTWEYKTVKGRPNEERLNQLGAEGWELVAIDTAIPSPESTVSVFKRPGGRRFMGKKDDGPRPGDEGGKKDEPPKKGEPKKGFGGTFGPGPGGFPGGGIAPSGPGGFGSGFGGVGSSQGGKATTGTVGGSGSSSTPGFSGPPMRKEPGRPNFQILFLQNSNAPDLAKVVKVVLPPDVIITADPRSNAIILVGPPREAAEVTELIRTLDRPMEDRRADQPPQPKRTAVSKEEWSKKMEEWKAKMKK